MRLCNRFSRASAQASWHAALRLNIPHHLSQTVLTGRQLLGLHSVKRIWACILLHLFDSFLTIMTKPSRSPRVSLYRQCNVRRGVSCAHNRQHSGAAVRARMALISEQGLWNVPCQYQGADVNA